MDINFYASEIKSEATICQYGVNVLRVEAKGVNPVDILKTIDEADGLIFDNIVKAIGINRILNWIEKTKE